MSIKKVINTKLGTEINIITAVLMMWSVIVFFFNAAQIPSKIPIGTEKITENMLIFIDVRSLSQIITVALTFGWIVFDTPQSQRKMMFPNQVKYCFMTGTV